MEVNSGISFILFVEKSNVNLRSQLSTMVEVCKKLDDQLEVLIFVKDLSDDIKKAICGYDQASVIKHEAINFYPSALRSGLKQARHEKVLVCFSDDIVTAHCLEQIIIGLEHYQFICGARPILKEGLRISIYRWLWHKLVRCLFNINLKDINCPYKAFLRSKVNEIGFLESDGTLTHTELAARMKAKNMTIAEFPLESFHPESQETESYGFFVLFGTLCNLMKLKGRISKTQKRLLDESQFHDEWASSINVDKLLIHENFKAITAVENRYALNAMGDINGKRILDLGCGAGETSVYFALQGAQVTAVDISEEMISIVKQLAAKWNVDVDAKVIVGEDMELDSSSFDYVFGNGVLHHLDRKKAYNEINRVLKPGGKAIFIEPLCYNPVISVYRLLAKTVRTKNETPFRFSDFIYLKKLFAKVEHCEFWLMTQLIFIYFFVVKRSNPRKERYWKKVIVEADSIAGMFKKLSKIDEWLFKYMPFLKRFSWNTVIVLEKSE